MSRIVTPFLLLLLPVAAFLAFFHPAILQPGNTGWLIRGTDNGENALGAHAYWHDPAAGASLRTATLNAPDGVPLLYTDSNPLLTLTVKPFAALLPGDAQFVGPFVLLSLILQALVAWLLLRRHAPGPLALWVGVVLLAFPPTLANRFVHMNLMAHWTFLAALWLFLDAERGHRLRWWAPLIAVTAMIHSYLLVMVGAIWASAMLVRFVDGDRRTRWATLVQTIFILALVGVIARWLGVGEQVPAGNFGVFAMPLDALWNPGLDNFSNLLPTRARSTEQSFEGFQYLGAGGLMLVAAAIAIARIRPAREGERAVAQRLRGLVPALIVLAILAIARLPLPPVMLAILDPVRASGRLFWPIGYVLVLMAVLSVYRLSAERAAFVLIGAIALQVIDLTGMAGAIRAQSREADRHRLYVRTRDPRWSRVIGDSRSVAFIPGDVTRNLSLFQEVAWRAVDAGRPVTSVYAARTSRATTRRLEAERAAFDRGALVPGRLYVLIAPVPIPVIAGSRVLTLDGVTLVLPIAAPPGRQQ
ncbi:DUF6311 domain-containing protein [Sphingomonas sp. CROZ-RG-20F-R02-07]|uniref:DUF6311 domain-containing protein n=1 Tax=Sphingomonas sp. CROZ-RG-20F-R02-07 TaxID=2914832 RepID=UPI001F5A309A|nr:DUF6311 domain-containing protein [Sphingomonas sp. CROZ-RG-20F-R02-07]